MRYNEARARVPSPRADEPAANARLLAFKKLRSLRSLGLDPRTLNDLLLSVTIFVDYELTNSDPEINTIHEGMTDHEIIHKLSYWIAWRLIRRTRDELRKEFFPMRPVPTGVDDVGDKVLIKIFIAEQMERLLSIAGKKTDVGKVAQAILRDFKNSFENIIKGIRFNQKHLKVECPGINVDEALRLLKAEMRDQPNSLPPCSRPSRTSPSGAAGSGRP
jgi:hypothetical protein